MEPRTLLIKQTLRKNLPSTLQVAIQYYTVLNVLQQWDLTPKEIQLLSFTAVRGSISSGGAKESFIKQFGSSKACIGNMIHRLWKLGFLVKEDGNTRVHPELKLKNYDCLLLNILFENKKA